MKIDVTKINGYAEMTAEQKLAALEAIDVPDPVDLAGYVKKDIADKYASEAAEAKRVARETQTAEQVAAAEQKEMLDKMQSELEQLRTDKSIAEHKANFVSLGYDETLASETAKALVSGDMAMVFTNQKKFIEAKEKAIRADVLKDTPRPGGAGGTQDKAQEDVDLASELGKARSATMNNQESILEQYK